MRMRSSYGILAWRQPRARERERKIACHNMVDDKECIKYSAIISYIVADL